jgi:hypothetical protein
LAALGCCACAPDMIVSMDVEIASAEIGDIHQVLGDHPRYWGERDLRSLHLLSLVHEFGSTCLVAVPGTGSAGTSSVSSRPRARGTCI